MKFRELIAYLDEAYPRSGGFPGDGDGVDVCADYDAQISGALIALDVTLGAIEYARAHAYDCIITHHAMLYRPLAKLDADLGHAVKKAAMLARYNICAAAFHTRLDAVQGGVNDCLLDAVGLKNAEPLFTGDIAIGRLCNLDISAADLTEQVSESLKRFYADKFGADLRRRASCFTDDGAKKIKRLAVVGGGGMGTLENAAKAGADAFFTGEGKYHEILEAREAYNMSVITAGHYETEAVVLPEIRRAILAGFPNTRTGYFIDLP